MLRKILTLALLLIFSFINHAQILLNPAQITNIAAKQRMYSQRLSRAKVSKIYNVDADNMQRQLTTGIILFEENLKVLGSYVASNEYKLKVDQVNYLWKDFIKQIESDDVSAANKIIKTNTKGSQIGSNLEYGCSCEFTEEITLGIFYEHLKKQVSFYKNGINQGVAFNDVQKGLHPSLDLWFQYGTVEILKNTAPEVFNSL